MTANASKRVLMTNSLASFFSIDPGLARSRPATEMLASRLQTFRVCKPFRHRINLSWLTRAAPGSRLHMTASVLDRQSVVEGKSVSVRVDLGGRRNIKKNKTTK